MNRFIFAAAATLLAAPAYAIDIQPGLWQDTEAGEVNGQKQPPKVTTDCVKPEDAKDMVKKAQAELEKSKKEMGQEQCAKANIQQTGNTILFEMKCGDPKQAAMDVVMTINILSPQHTTTVSKTTMSMMGQKMTSNMTTDSKWIAASCSK